MVPECEKSSATTYYWYREALDISNNISESGGLNWKMTVCLLVAWTMVCLAMIKGIQSSGKVRRVCILLARDGRDLVCRVCMQGAELFHMVPKEARLCTSGYRSWLLKHSDRGIFKEYKRVEDFV